MGRSTEDRRRRFEQQAGWTGQARRYLLGKMPLRWGRRVLEVGCGSGAITTRIRREARLHTRVYGLDIERELLTLAQSGDQQTRFTTGDGLALPFASGTFDATTCHFFLLWIPDPLLALAEMARVTRRGGLVMAFAEPDYGGRIDAPPALALLGRLQAESLRRQGAAPCLGRELAELFNTAGLAEVETGVLGGQWRRGSCSAQEIEAEWETLEEDLEGMLPPAELARLKQANAGAWAEGSRVLFVPTFYAVGKVIHTNEFGNAAMKYN